MGQKSHPNDAAESDDLLPAMDHRGLTAKGKRRINHSALTHDYLVRALEDADPAVLSAISSAVDAAHGKRYTQIQAGLYDDDVDSGRQIRQAYWDLLDDLKGLGLLASELKSDQVNGVPSEDDPRHPF